MITRSAVAKKTTLSWQMGGRAGEIPVDSSS